MNRARCSSARADVASRPCTGSPRRWRVGSRCVRNCSTRRVRSTCSRSCDQLTLLQIDPTAAIAPSADLVAWSRLGSSVPAGPPPAGARAGSHAVRARRADPADGRRRPLSRRRGRLAAVGATRATGSSANDRFRRDVLKLLGRSGPLTLARHPRHVRSAVGVDRLDEQPQRHPDAGVPDRCAARSRSPGASAGSGCGTCPGGSTRPVDVPSADDAHADQERAAACGARHRPPEVAGDAGRAGRRRRGRRAGRGRGREGRVARRPRGDCGGLRRAHRAALAVRPARSTTASAPWSCSTSSTRSRCTSRRRKRRWGYFALPVLHRRPARREGRRRRRPQGVRAAGARDPRGRQVHPRHHEGRRGRARQTWPTWLGLATVEPPLARRRTRCRGVPDARLEDSGSGLSPSGTAGRGGVAAAGDCPRTGNLPWA